MGVFQCLSCGQTALVDKMLWVVGGFEGIFGSVEMHALELLVVPCK